MMGSVIEGRPNDPSMTLCIYRPPCCVKAMKGRAFSLTLLLLLVPLAGCVGSKDTNDRYVIVNGTLTLGVYPMNGTQIHQDGLCEDRHIFTIKDYVDSQEFHAQSDVGIGKFATVQEAIEAMEEMGGNETHDPNGRPYGSVLFSNCEYAWQEYNWADYEEYGWEVDLISGNGTFDVIWYTNEQSIQFMDAYQEAYEAAIDAGDWEEFKTKQIWNASYGTTELSLTEISENGSVGPVETPPNPLDCGPEASDSCLIPMIWDHHTLIFSNTGTTVIEIEYSIYGWK